MLDSISPLDRRFLYGFGSALLSVGLLLSFTDDPNDIRWFALQGCGWLAFAFANVNATSVGRAVRNVQFALAAAIAFLLAIRILSIESPFSDSTTTRIEAVAGLAFFILVPAYLVREILRPKSADYRAIETAHKASRHRTREHAKDRAA